MKIDEVKSQDIKFTGKYGKTVYETLWFSYRAHIWILFILLIMGLLGRALLLGNANIIGIWVDTFCKNSEHIQCRPQPAFFAHLSSNGYLLLLSLMTGLGFIFTLIFRVGFSVISAQAVSQIYDETTYRSSRMPMDFFDNTPAGRIVTRFSSDYGNVFRLFGGPLAEFLSIVFDLSNMIILISIASPFYLPSILVIGVFDYIVYRANRNRLRAARRELSASRSPSIAHFSETAQGSSTIRSFNKQSSFSKRFEKLDSYYLQQRQRVVRNLMQFSLQINSMTALLLLATGLLAFSLLQKGLITVGSLGVAFGFIVLSGTTVQMFFEWLAQFEEAMIGVERLDNYIHKPLELGARLPSSIKFPTEHWTLKKEEDSKIESEVLTNDRAASVEFKDVWFRYNENLPYVLKGISFKVAPGERLGIVGRTGSGKSSLTQTLLYLYPIQKGAILLNNIQPRLNPEDSTTQRIDLEVYRKAISFISQDSILFKGTLKENLYLGPRVPHDTLFNALRKVGLEEWANEKDLHMHIEEKGENLSLGEKQLICMARCLLQNTPVVIMDEATSSVDPKSEEILVKATHDFFQGRTQIIIAHRLSTLEKCDRVLWLHDGEIKMLGAPNKVIPVFEKSNLSLTDIGALGVAKKPHSTI